MGGVGVRGAARRVEGKTGKREGAPGTVGVARAASIGPRPAGVGGGAAVRQWREAGRG
jgi:hypothetical protein